jgi:hypothetical protein
VSLSLGISVIAVLLAGFSTYRTYIKGEELTAVVADVLMDGPTGQATIAFANSGSVPVVLVSVGEIVELLVDEDGRPYAPVLETVELLRTGEPFKPITINPSTIELLDIRLKGTILASGLVGSYQLAVQVLAVGPTGWTVDQPILLATADVTTPDNPDDTGVELLLVEHPTRILTHSWLTSTRRRLGRPSRRPLAKHILDE